jgi:hypothetical protein
MISCTCVCFIGDRRIDERYFGIVQKDGSKELERWLDEVISKGVKYKAKFAIVTATDHCAGFGPATASSYRKERACSMVRNEV